MLTHVNGEHNVSLKNFAESILRVYHAFEVLMNANVYKTDGP